MCSSGTVEWGLNEYGMTLNGRTTFSEIRPFNEQSSTAHKLKRWLILEVEKPEASRYIPLYLESGNNIMMVE